MLKTVPSIVLSKVHKGLMAFIKGLQTLYEPLTGLHFPFYKVVQSDIITLT